VFYPRTRLGERHICTVHTDINNLNNKLHAVKVINSVGNDSLRMRLAIRTCQKKLVLGHVSAFDLILFFLTVFVCFPSHPSTLGCQVNIYRVTGTEVRSEAPQDTNMLVVLLAAVLLHCATPALALQVTQFRLPERNDCNTWMGR
jgi:hypothetical protein